MIQLFRRQVKLAMLIPQTVLLRGFTLNFEKKNYSLFYITMKMGIFKL